MDIGRKMWQYVNGTRLIPSCEGINLAMKKLSIDIPTPPGATTLQLLLRARLMFAHALEHASLETEFDGMLAVLSLDSTVEYLLRIVASHLELEAVTGKSFDIVDVSSLAGSISKTLHELTGVRLPYLAEIKLQRSARNLVQHGAVSPLADLRRFCTLTERFFNQVLIEVFGLRLPDLKVSGVVKDDAVRAHLENAELALDRSEWLECVVACRDAFQNAYFNSIQYSEVTLSLYPAIVQAKGDKDMSMWALTTILEELELSRLGINNREYRRFREYLDYIPWEHRPTGDKSHRILERPWKRNDAVFCYGFVSTVILQWQEKETPAINVAPELENDYEFTEHIGSVDISDKLGSGCSYHFGSDCIELLFLSGGTKREIESLTEGGSYIYKKQRYVGGQKDRHREEPIQIIAKHAHLVTCDPERWGVVLWYQYEGDKTGERSESGEAGGT